MTADSSNELLTELRREIDRLSTLEDMNYRAAIEYGLLLTRTLLTINSAALFLGFTALATLSSNQKVDFSDFFFVGLFYFFGIVFAFFSGLSLAMKHGTDYLYYSKERFKLVKSIVASAQNGGRLIPPTSSGLASKNTGIGNGSHETAIRRATRLIGWCVGSSIFCFVCGCIKLARQLS